MIGIIDADLIGRKKHRFPNLACMKISGFYKEQGKYVRLIIDYDDVRKLNFEKIFISKVFTDTEVPEDVISMTNVEYGGTGFFYDKAKPLPCEVEHSFPDYDLYSDWVINMREFGKKNEFEYYTDYSIGFTTRGCFRQCEFCVNKNYTKVSEHSPLSEFVSDKRKKICLLDDNILGYAGYKNIFNDLISTNKPFQYKQGMDFRLITKDKINMLNKCKYIGDYIFAFDDIKDKDDIIKKLEMWKIHGKKRIKFYIFCGFDRNDVWDYDFWIRDLKEVFERIEILIKYNALPYIMRFNRYEDSPYRGTYINLARWCNQPHIFKSMSYMEMCEKMNSTKKRQGDCATMTYAKKLINDVPNVFENWYHMKWVKCNKKA